jgi:hypothetical protein
MSWYRYGMGTLVTDGLKSDAILDTAGLKPTKDGFRTGP